MGIFDADFWIGRGPGQSQQGMEGYGYNEARFGTGQAGDTLQSQFQQGAAGQGPSAAREQLGWGLGRANQAAMAQSRSMAGVNPAIAQRMSQQAMSQNAANANQQAAVMRAQEQAQQQGMLAQWLQSQRQAGMGLEQLRGQDQMGLNQLRLQQDLYNQQAQEQQGFLGTALGMAGDLAGALIPG